MSQPLDDKLKRQLRRRGAFALLVLLVAFSGLLWRAYHLQIKGEMQLVGKVRDIEKTNASREKVVQVEAERGNIVDRNGELLAASAPVVSIFANPQQALCSLDFMQHLTNQSASALLNPKNYEPILSVWAEAQERLVIQQNASKELAQAALACPKLYGMRVKATLEEDKNHYFSSAPKLAKWLAGNPNAHLQLYHLKPARLASAVRAQLGGLPQMAKLLGLSNTALLQKLSKKNSTFRYLKRHMPPSEGLQIAALHLEGIGSEREYRRYYPAAEVTGHLLGMTNIYEDQQRAAQEGIEGLETLFDSHLGGEAGLKKVVVDSSGQAIAEVEWQQKPKFGKPVELSLDMRMQYAAYRALKEAVIENQAQTGSAVILDAQTGEVLALVNQPTFNPNNRQNIEPKEYRNRAVLDFFEPGSVMKPITIASALEFGVVDEHSRFDTSPGYMVVGGKPVKDARDYGVLDLAGIIKKSSNVGATKVVGKLTPEQQYQMYQRFGFGEPTASAYPDETAGLLHPYQQWRLSERATMSFGYGIAVSTLQLAQAYAAIANDGVRMPISFLKGGSELPAVRVISAGNAKKVREMMRAVVEPDGTGRRAAVAGYTIAGKTGTAKKTKENERGYEEGEYASVFAGIAPAKNPKLVMVVMIDGSQGRYYGGEIAAPIFGSVMRQALRIRNIAPDNLPNQKIMHASAKGGQDAIM